MLAPGSSRIAIVGAGHVGVTVAYACLMKGVARHIALYGRHNEKVRAEVLDLSHALQFVPMATIEGADDIEVCRDADIVVLAVGGVPRAGQTRLDLAGVAVETCRTLVPGLVEVAADAIFVVITNPVDVITYATLMFSGLPAHRVVGSGTLLDSSRFRQLIAEHCGVAVQSVHAYIVGEHGDSEIPLWTSATIGGVPLLEWNDPGGPPLDQVARDRLFRQVVDAGYEIVAGKGYTNYAIALVTTRIIEAVLRNEHPVLPVSSLLSRQDGIAGCCLSLPCVIGSSGIEWVMPGRLSDDEHRGLARSARVVRAAIEKLDLAGPVA